MKDKPALPFFGPYVMVPLWFRNYCVPKIAPSSASVWELLLSRTRWKQGKMTVAMPIREVARLCGLSKSCAASAISELIGNDLLSIPDGPKGKKRKAYTVVLYTPENAKVRFKDGVVCLSQKSGQESVPNFSTKLA